VADWLVGENRSGNGTDRGGFDPLPPHNGEMEEAVLGSLMIDLEAIEVVAPILRAEDFYYPRNRDVYAAILALFERREPTDYVMVSDELERRGRLDRVGGEAYLSRVLTVVPTALNVESYARVVERTATWRRVIGAAGRIAAIAYEDSPEIAEGMERIEAELSAATRRMVGGGFAHVRELVSRYLDGISVPVEGEEGVPRAAVGAERIPTGFLDLDALLGGFSRGELIVIAARPSLGKSTLVLNILTWIATRLNLAAGLFSLEMSADQVAGRLVSAASGVDSTRLRHGRLNEVDLAKLAGGFEVLSTAPIFVDDTPQIGIAELRSRARRLASEVPLGILAVDYLQMVAGPSTGPRPDRVREVSEVSRSLKALARELEVPVIALSQLNRQVERRTDVIPRLSDLRESGSIEQDADVVMFIHRDDAYDRETERKGIADLHVAKNRNGPTGMCSLLFVERTTRFVNLADEEVRKW